MHARLLSRVVAVIVTAACLITTQTSWAEIINVPADQPTIQAAVDAAADGDEVVVANGTWTGPGNRNVSFLGKAITVRSANGPATCVIDCQGTREEMRRAFLFTEGEGPGSRLEGLTIRNGGGNYDGLDGGAILLQGASPIIVSCRFYANDTGFYDWELHEWYRAKGGAIYMTGGAAPTLEDCEFTGNGATPGYGGAIYAEAGCFPTMIRCRFHGNAASGVSVEDPGPYELMSSGGAFLGSGTIIDCDFEDNRGDLGGAINGHGLVIRDSRFIGNGIDVGVCHCSVFGGGAIHGSFVATGCRFAGNFAIGGYWLGEGGAVRIVGVSARLVDCVLAGNLSDNGGAVAARDGATVELVNCLVVGNETPWEDGNAVLVGSASVSLVNCTVVANGPPPPDSSIYTEGGSCGLTNCIVWNDTLGSGVTATYSDVEGGHPGEGNVDADPLFVDPQNGDYRLIPGSPCIDAGDTEIVPGDLIEDLGAMSRLVNDPCTPDTGVLDGERPPVDMGAYEYQPPCPADSDCSGDVGFDDLLAFLSAWGSCGGCVEDVDQSGDVGFVDLLLVLSTWGSCPHAGACCLADGTCVQAAFPGDEDCLSQGGIYQGDDTVCADVVCIQPGGCTFGAHLTYGAGINPRSVAVGDLDGDLDLDLAVANDFSGDVSVLLGVGDGTFAADVPYYAGGQPVSVAIGDLDGDLDLDLAVANLSNHVSVLMNAGDGTFASGVTYGTGAGPYSVAIGDLDGDGDLDLAVANSNSDDVSVLLNAGDGTFASGVTYGTGAGPYSVAIGDLDGDGDLDLAMANRFSDDVSTLLNYGDGSFAPHVPYYAGGQPQSVAIGDLDGDLDLDLAVTNASGDAVSIHLNQGDGTYAAHVTFGVGDYPLSVAMGDLDGDLDLDLAVANPFGDAVSILLNHGDGTFAADVTYNAGHWPWSVAIGDLDGDLDLDLAVANTLSYDVSIFLNDCSPSP